MYEYFSEGVELLKFEKKVGGEWYDVHMAINGVLCVPFEVPTPTIHDFMEQGEQALAAYLERQAHALIDEWGDARSPRANLMTQEA